VALAAKFGASQRSGMIIANERAAAQAPLYPSGEGRLF
jgi:hypothetical protein